jgi:hypothetical protein
MVHQIGSHLHERQGKALTNFPVRRLGIPILPNRSCLHRAFFT